MYVTVNRNSMYAKQDHVREFYLMLNTITISTNIVLPSDFDSRFVIMLQTSKSSTTSD